MITTTYIASLIFFNARRALGTWLRVGKDPIRCLRLVLTLLLPLCKMRTRNRSMWLLPTLETEACLAYVALGIATHVREHPSPACECDLPTSRTRTPARHTVCLNERSELVLFVLR